ncbi:hypothetical protein D3C81_898610 [compost metagenome]
MSSSFVAGIPSITISGPPPDSDVYPRTLIPGELLALPEVGVILRLAIAPCNAVPTFVIGLLSKNFSPI